MKLTKKTRLEIYKEALWRLRFEYHHGLCTAIFRVLTYDRNIDFGEAGRIVYGLGLRNFPELYKKKPEKPYSRHWFKPGTKAPRIRILKQAIKELEEKLK